MFEKELNWTLFPVMHSFLFFLHLPVTLCCVPSFPASLSLCVFKLLNVGCSAQSIGLRDTAEKRERQRERETGHSVSVCRWTWCPERDKQEAHRASRTLTAQSAWHCSHPHTCTRLFFHLESACEDTHRHNVHLLNLSLPVN